MKRIWKEKLQINSDQQHNCAHLRKGRKSFSMKAKQRTTWDNRTELEESFNVVSNFSRCPYSVEVVDVDPDDSAQQFVRRHWMLRFLEVGAVWVFLAPWVVQLSVSVCLEWPNIPVPNSRKKKKR